MPGRGGVSSALARLAIDGDTMSQASTSHDVLDGIIEEHVPMAYTQHLKSHTKKQMPHTSHLAHKNYGKKSGGSHSSFWDSVGAVEEKGGHDSLPNVSFERRLQNVIDDIQSIKEEMYRVVETVQKSDEENYRNISYLASFVADAQDSINGLIPAGQQQLIIAQK